MKKMKKIIIIILGLTLLSSITMATEMRITTKLSVLQPMLIKAQSNALTKGHNVEFNFGQFIIGQEVSDDDARLTKKINISGLGTATSITFNSAEAEMTSGSNKPLHVHLYFSNDEAKIDSPSSTFVPNVTSGKVDAVLHADITNINEMAPGDYKVVSNIIISVN